MHACRPLLLFSIVIIFVNGSAIAKSIADSLSQDIPLDSFHYELPASESKLHIDWKCLTCKAAVFTFRAMLSFNRSFDEIASMFVTGCKTFHIEKFDVCQGIAKEFQDESLTVIRNSTLSTDEICSFVLGAHCPSDFDDRFKWNVTLPDIPKPPLVPSAAPVVHAPKLRVLHLSDIHVDFHYKPGSNSACGKPLCCQDDDVSLEGVFAAAGKWGDYNGCDTPPWTVENLFQQLSAEKPFDYILWTGDETSHRVWDMSRSEVLHALDYLTKLFIKYFPGVQVFTAVGNHETAPVNSFPPSFVTGNRSINWLYDGLANNWTVWLPNDTVPTIKRGGFFTTVVKPGFRIVSLNTNYCNNENFWLMLNITDPVGELEWLVSVLQNAEKVGEKVQIIGHIPPGSTDCLKWWSWNYYAIVNRYEGVIAAQFFGHTHFDSWQIFYDVDDGFKRPVSVAYVGPSVTPLSALNMGYRVYEIDGFYPGSSWAVLDHETFVLNLTEANLLDRPLWKKEYSAKEAYNLSSLTSAAWDEVFHKMKTNDALFSKYFKFYYKLHPTSEKCDESCRRNMLCEIKAGRSNDPHLCDDLFNGQLTTGTGRSRYSDFVDWLRQKKAC